MKAAAASGRSVPSMSIPAAFTSISSDLHSSRAGTLSCPFLTLHELYHNACAHERGAAESTPVHQVCREPDVYVHITAVSLWLSLEDPEKELLKALLRAMKRTVTQQVGRKAWPEPVGTLGAAVS